MRKLIEIFLIHLELNILLQVQLKFQVQRLVFLLLMKSQSLQPANLGLFWRMLGPKRVIRDPAATALEKEEEELQTLCNWACTRIVISMLLFQSFYFPRMDPWIL